MSLMLSKFPYWNIVSFTHPPIGYFTLLCFALVCLFCVFFFGGGGGFRFSLLCSTLKIYQQDAIKFIFKVFVWVFNVIFFSHQTYAVVTSLSEQTKKVVKLNTEDHEPEDIDRGTLNMNPQEII